MIALRGTGSKRVVCEQVFVPEHRTITAVGTSADPWPGWGTHENPLYAGGLFSLLFFELAAIAIGVARGADRRVRGGAAEQGARHPAVRPARPRRRVPAPSRRGDRLVDVAEAALLEGTDRYLDQAKRAFESGHPADETAEETRRLVLLEQQCIRLSGEAVDLLFRTGGTSGARSGSRMANAMLALTVLRTHMGLQWDRTMTNLGRLRLGLPAGFV